MKMNKVQFNCAVAKVTLLADGSIGFETKIAGAYTTFVLTPEETEEIFDMYRSIQYRITKERIEKRAE
jgi:hypothetical protein